MTVPAGQTPIITYVYSGAGDYDFAFRVFEESDLVLTHIDSNGVRTLLIIGEYNDYTVSLIGDGTTGGTCHLTSSLVGGTLEIRRSLLQEQPTDWVNNDPFNAELLELDLDRAIMIIQEMQVTVDGAYVATNWRADWLPNHPYYVRDLVVNSTTGNIYTALTDHVSTSDFDTDLANGNWAILIDVAAVEAARLDAEQSAAEALSSANSASTSEANAASSETQAGISEVNAANDAQDSANCRQASYDHAVISQAEAWNSEAERLTAESFADEDEDVPVKIYTSNGDGTFTATDTDPVQYSSFHWKQKASAAAAGGVDTISVTAPVTKSGTENDPIIGVDGSPAGGTTGQVLAKASNSDHDNEWIDPPSGGGLAWFITATPVVGANASGYIMDTSSEDGIINLPAGQEGFIVGAQHLRSFDKDQTYFIKLVPNGTDKIHGENETLLLDTQSAELVYSDATNGWIVQESTPIPTDSPVLTNSPIKVSDIFPPAQGGLLTPPSGVYVTGNIYGLEYSYLNTNQITVEAGICMDSLNTTVLTGAASQTVNIPTAINTVYNLFLCDDGVVRTDTDVDGATLLAGSVNQLRWIGFVLTDASGDVINFYCRENMLHFNTGDAGIGTISSTSWVSYDLSHLIPVSRTVRLGFYPSGASTANSSTVYFSAIGGDDQGMKVCSGSTGDTYDRKDGRGMVVYNGTSYFRMIIGNTPICIKIVELLR